ncbi:MAG: type I-C CRISPR-associated protein Cas7/Csd2 [Planctomycetota bacterium]
MPVISNRHDILILFDVTNGNPNGDPDAGNMPRIDPTSNKGLVSDVCLKRKIRNFVATFRQDEQGNPLDGFDILVRQGRILNTEIKSASEQVKKDPRHGGASDKGKAEATKNWLCSRFYDVRTFGGVLSTGTGDDVLKGSAFGQVRGPIQFTFGQSCHPIVPLEISITRCAVTREEDESKERTMGTKHIVPYALYVAKAFVSPVFAENTGFSDDDLALFFEALGHLFDHDQSAARAEMVVRGIFDFEHVGTQSPKNGAQNRREARLGCAHAHKLFEGIKIDLKDTSSKMPNGFGDYVVRCVWEEKPLPAGVRLHLRHEDPLRTIPRGH